MQGMFLVRAAPSRVLLLLRRRVVLVARRPSPRSEIAAHSARPPVPRCAVGCRGLQSGHQHVVRPTDFGEALFRRWIVARTDSVVRAEMGG
jgi:hypothetical protein